MLPQSVSLALLRLYLLTHTFALGLSWNTGARGSLLLDLLPPQTLHLLPRITITTSRLPGQICHLSFPRLLCGYVRLRLRAIRTIAQITGLRAVVRRLLVDRPTLIRDLKFLVP